jgi:7-cyano-7-deazaguanine synthase
MAISAAKSALVVLSGGQDSTTCLLWAKARFDEVHAITFDYGQKHRVEIAAAGKVAQMVGVASHRVIDVRGLLLGRSPLIDPSVPLETYADHDSMEQTIGGRVELTFVPLRNMLFAVIAANAALALDCYDIVLGVCAMDNANYPDCTEAFVNRTEQTIREALGMLRADYSRSGKPLMRILTPLLFKTKDETVLLAAEHEGWREVMAQSHTCYAGEVPPCGKCHACILRAKGFADAGIPDPLVERFHTSDDADAAIQRAEQSRGA